MCETDSLTHCTASPRLASADYIHIRIQQRNGRKTITTLSGVPTEYDPKKLLKAFKSTYLSDLPTGLARPGR